MSNDPYQAPSAQNPTEPQSTPRALVFGLLGIIAIAAVVSVQNYRRRERMRATAARVQAASDARYADTLESPNATQNSEAKEWPNPSEAPDSQ